MAPTAGWRSSSGGFSIPKPLGAPRKIDPIHIHVARKAATRIYAKLAGAWSVRQFCVWVLGRRGEGDKPHVGDEGGFCHVVDEWRIGRR